MSPGSLLAASFNTPVIKYRQVGITVTAPETGQSVTKTSIVLVVEKNLEASRVRGLWQLSRWLCSPAFAVPQTAGNLMIKNEEE